MISNPLHWQHDIPVLQLFRTIARLKKEGVQREKKLKDWSLRIRLKHRATTRGSSFRRVVMSGSTCPKLAGHWPAELDQAPSMNNLYHSGFAFSPTTTDLRLLIRKLPKGIAKILPHEFEMKVDLLDEKRYREHQTVFTSRQIMDQIFSLSDINKNEGRAMGLSELLSVDINNDNLKKFNQDLGEMLLFLEKTWMKNGWRFVQEAAKRVFAHEEPIDAASVRHRSEEGESKLSKVAFSGR